ncbi:unnamed protein product, partial [marine sediment metagenome]
MWPTYALCENVAAVVQLPWHHVKYATGDKILAGLDVDARKAKRGLWSDPKPIAPWEWRRIQAAKRKTNKPATTGNGEYWLNTSSNIRHNS